MSPQGSAERTGVIWGVVLALGLLVALGFTMSEQETRAADPHELLARWFSSSEIPGDYVIAEAQTLPRGDLAVRLTPAERIDEAPRIVVAAEVEGEREGDPKPFGSFDWSKVPVGELDTLPREVLIAEIARENAADELREMFDAGMNLNGDWKSVPKSGAKRILERGRLTWGAFSAPYVIEREFENGGTFRDFLKVNLSRESSPRILIARWNRGFPASKTRVEELLARLPSK